jgi:hypothetical protein
MAELRDHKAAVQEELVMQVALLLLEIFLLVMAVMAVMAVRDQDPLEILEILALHP